MEFAGAGHTAGDACSGRSRASPAPLPQHDSRRAWGVRNAVDAEATLYTEIEPGTASCCTRMALPMCRFAWRYA